MKTKTKNNSMKQYFNKQLLEEQYSSVLKGVVVVEDENMTLAQVCNLAMKDVNHPDGVYSLADYIALDIMYANIYNEFAHYYAGTNYGKTPEVCEHVEKYSNDKDFVEKMVKHAEHYLNQQIAEAA